MKNSTLSSFSLTGFWLALTLFPYPATCARSDLPKEITRSQRILLREPTIDVNAEGMLRIRVETVVPVSNGRAYLGLPSFDSRLQYPVYRIRGKTILAEADSLLFEFDLNKLERKTLERSPHRESHTVKVALRICLFGDDLYTIDRVFSYSHSSEGEFQRSVALIEGPFVDWVTDSGAVLSWKFDKPVRCKLDVSPGRLHFESPHPKQGFEVSLVNLIPATRYSYTITWTESPQPPNTFRGVFQTAPPAASSKPFKFAVLSDSRATYGAGDRSVEGVNQRTLQALLNQAYSRDVSLIVIPGDLVSGHTSDVTDLETQFRSWKRTVAPLGSRIPIYEGLGNHDVTARFFEGSRSKDYIPRSGDEASEVIFADHFVNPTNGPDPVGPEFPPYRETVYSFDYGNSHFTILNSNYMQKGSGESVAGQPGEREGTLRPEQLDWLGEDLKSARLRGLKHLFVFVHEPAFPNGGHAEDAMWWDGKFPEVVQMRDKFWKILCEYEVLVVFCGDEHNYSLTLIDDSVNPEFTVPVWQVVTGGAGAPYYIRDEGVPWAEAVRSFYPSQHGCFLSVAGDDVLMEVVTPEGVLLESVQLKGGGD
jgi:3',5'-cyclic AMP phosphodiesterase CpdA